MARILIVEDEPEMASGLKDNFEFDGHEVHIARNGEEALQMAEDLRPDLIILDVMLPRKSGFDVCRELRQKGTQTPIIMLTARGQEIDKVLGLELGADDYITKPFSVRELLARAHAVLRRSSLSGMGSPVVRVGRLQVDFEKCRAWDIEGNEVPMTIRELELLRYLVERPNRSVSREELLNEVWGYQHYPISRTVDNFILRLRKHIEEDPARPRHILTVHGIGYRFVP
ncbi:MAG: response regulator transcription factor [candidate division KSB1 bacterium]|nr:response regulator transcription factor [candidate division KSB1 bacterium]